MRSILSRGIRPSLHSIVIWLIVAVLSCSLIPGLASSFADFRQAQATKSQYNRDCAGVSNVPGKPTGPCYVIIEPSISYDEPGAGGGDHTLYADIPGLGLDSTRVSIPGDFDPDHLPIGAATSVQIWRNHATKVLMAKVWRNTSDNPLTHTGTTQILLLILAIFISWAILLIFTLLLIKGILTARKDSRLPAEGVNQP